MELSHRWVRGRGGGSSFLQTRRGDLQVAFVRLEETISRAMIRENSSVQES